jgi:acetylornithine deacetylase
MSELNLPTIERDYLVQTLTDLVRINSINPSLVPGGAGEAEIAAYLAQAMATLGLEVTTHEPEPGRVSVVGRLKGSGRGRSLMLNGHIDTVGIEGMADPFSAEIREGCLYSRGAFDMKGSIAAGMAAVKALVDAGLHLAGDVLLAAVADEEYASLGTAGLVHHYRVDGAIVTEPTREMNLCLAHKGFIWLEVETFGRAAHGSRFDLGIDANMRMGRFLAELDGLEQALRHRPGHALLGPPSLHAALLQGGTELSAYAARCSLKIERRTLPGETEAGVIAELQALIDRLTAADPTFDARITPLFVREPFEISPQAHIVSVVEQAAAKVLNRVPARIGETFWADAALLSAAGVETVMIGPIGGGAHAIEEWVDLQSLVDLAQLLAEAAANYCR